MANKRSRAWCFTYNNYPDELSDDNALDAWLHRLGGKYCIAGREVAPATATRHLQGYIQFTDAKSLSAVRTILPGCHLESARGKPHQCAEYCRKDGLFREIGVHPQDPGTREKLRWEHARTMAQTGSFEEIPADIYIRYIGNLERIRANHLPPLESLETPCGIWLLGPSGAGKSRGVRSQFPLVYPKPLNKWWDGYTDQKCVLLDDVDDNQSSWIGNFLKIWSDHYPFIAEKKGGSRLIRPDLIIVTSQYPIEHLFKCGLLQQALNRRFTVVHVEKDIPIGWPLERAQRRPEAV